MKNQKCAATVFQVIICPGISILETYSIGLISLGDLSVLIHFSICNCISSGLAALCWILKRLFSWPLPRIPDWKNLWSGRQIKHVMYWYDAELWQLSDRKRGCPKTKLSSIVASNIIVPSVDFISLWIWPLLKSLSPFLPALSRSQRPTGSEQPLSWCINYVALFTSTNMKQRGMDVRLHRGTVPSSLPLIAAAEGAAD